MLFPSLVNNFEQFAGRSQRLLREDETLGHQERSVGRSVLQVVVVRAVHLRWVAGAK